jgi:hypothetical protein
MNRNYKTFGMVALLFGGWAFSWSTATSSTLVGADPAATKSEPLPVEKDMHEFMEYVFQPTFKRLKPLMAAEPKENAGWKGIKADALSLAEAGNLLLSRGPEKDREKWSEWSVAVREAGGLLYQAAKKKDYAESRKQYEAMLVKCNACHTHFANGKHQLAP